ncbi:hypothetical protein ABZ746_21100 [Streptomyces sp. NPDC020096]
MASVDGPLAQIAARWRRLVVDSSVCATALPSPPAGGDGYVRGRSASAPDADAIGRAVVTEVTELTAPDRSGPDEAAPEESAGTVPNPMYDPRPGVRRPNRPGPTPHPDVFCGWVGETVRELDSTSEADPVAVLVNLLSAAGAIIGRKPHVWVGNDRHPALIWALTIGATGDGRKGSATSTARRVLAAAVPDFFGPDHTPSGLNSGEGLIEYVKDDDSENAFDDSLRWRRLLQGDVVRRSPVRRRSLLRRRLVRRGDVLRRNHVRGG